MSVLGETVLALSAPSLYTLPAKVRDRKRIRDQHEHKAAGNHASVAERICNAAYRSLDPFRKANVRSYFTVQSDAPAFFPRIFAKL